MKKLVLFLQPNIETDNSSNMLTINNDSQACAVLISPQQKQAEFNTPEINSENIKTDVENDNDNPSKIENDGFLIDVDEESDTTSSISSIESEKLVDESEENGETEIKKNSHFNVESADQKSTIEFIPVTRIEEILNYIAKDINEQNIRSFVIIPGEDVLNCDLKIPAKQFKQAQKALPYLVEDQIASDPKDCFIALGERKGEIVPCAIIYKESLAAAHEFLLENRLYAEKLSTDKELLASYDTSIHIFDNRAVLISPTHESFAFDLNLLDIYLDKLKSPEENAATSNDKPLVEEITEDDEEDVLSSADLSESDLVKEKLSLFFYQDGETSIQNQKDFVFQTIELYKKEQGFDFKLEESVREEKDLYIELAELVSDRISKLPIINFLQAEFKPKRIASGFAFKLDVNWKPVAALLCAFVILFFVSIFIETKRYENSALKADEDTKAVFREIFPKTNNYTRMKFRVSDLLKGNAAPSDNQFLNTFFKFSEAMHAINSQQQNSIVPSQIQYEQNISELRIDVVAKDFETLNALKELVESKNMQLEIASTSTEDNGVKGRLKVKLNP